LVLYAGTLGYINGVDYLARLAAAVAPRNPEVRFLVMGGGREEELVRRTAQQLGVLDRNFFMLPPVPKREMPAIYSAANLAASVFLDLPEMWANSANKVFDALAAGRAIAINHEGWLADLIRETGCGVVLDARNMELAAETLVCRLADRLWQARAGAAARRVGLERFDRDKLAAELEAVLVAAAAPQGTTAAGRSTSHAA
jgi:glycosyltransferase involved in cell wall biosynthesis